MTINVRNNADLLISQWKTAPRLQALARGLIGAVQESIIDPLTTLEDTQNLERADRAGLNDIGERLAIARSQEVPTDIEFFGFDMSGTGFDQAPFFSSLIGNILVEDEEDSAYREALRARGRMLLGGSSFTDFVRALEGSETQYESIVDDGGGEFTITVTRQAEKNRINDLINRKALPIPAGVGINIVVSVTTGDQVYWGTLDDPSDLSGFEAGATTYPYHHDQQRLPVPTFNGSKHLAFAQRSSDAPVATITTRGFDQTQAFIRTQNALEINGVDYDVWITRRKIIGSKAAGDIVQITK